MLRLPSRLPSLPPDKTQDVIIRISIGIIIAALFGWCVGAAFGRQIAEQAVHEQLEQLEQHHQEPPVNNPPFYMAFIALVVVAILGELDGARHNYVIRYVVSRNNLDNLTNQSFDYD